MNAAELENFAKDTFSRKFGVALNKARRPGFPKEFDLVPEDGQIVGDAKSYAMVGGTRIPPAKWSAIAEPVWFL